MSCRPPLRYAGRERRHGRGLPGGTGGRALPRSRAPAAGRRGCREPLSRGLLPGKRVTKALMNVTHLRLCLERFCKRLGGWEPAGGGGPSLGDLVASQPLPPWARPAPLPLAPWARWAEVGRPVLWLQCLPGPGGVAQRMARKWGGWGGGNVRASPTEPAPRVRLGCFCPTSTSN